MENVEHALKLFTHSQRLHKNDQPASTFSTATFARHAHIMYHLVNGETRFSSTNILYLDANLWM